MPYKPSCPRADLPSPAQIITDAIVARLEAGTRPWIKPWTGVATPRPLRSCGTPYRGCNIFWLWMIGDMLGFTSPYWMTYRQANVLGGQVRRGERSTIATFYKAYGKSTFGDGEAEDSVEVRRVLRSYAVFNACQIDGLPDRYFPAQLVIQPVADPDRLAALMKFFDKIPADVSHGGGEAYYSPAGDYIQLPPPENFLDPDRYGATRAHETAHWSGAAGRLGREFGKRFGDDKYGAEELVAELTSAIIGSEIGLPVDHLDDHASYMSSWLRILKSDSRALLTIASKADQAASYLLELGGYDPAPSDDEGTEAGANDDVDPQVERQAA